MIPWNIISKHGNPTKSLLVNARIKKVSKKETNQKGKKSQARKPFMCAEFEQVMRTLESMPCIYLALFLSTIFCFQYNLISRIDNALKLLKNNISKNPKKNINNILFVQDCAGARM